MTTYTYTGQACSGSFRQFTSAAIPFKPVGIEYRNPSTACGGGGAQAWAIGPNGEQHRIVVNSGTIWLVGSLVPNWDEDPPPPPNIAHDCINGSCIPQSTYNTPGIYQSLSDCEVACGTGCSGKCISNADWAQISGLASQLKNKNCS
jgi:hypothetical protein